MAIKSSGDPEVVILVRGPAAKELRTVTAFGNSMQPFIRPGAELHIEPVQAAAVFWGDVLTFCPKPETSITHRVVKILNEDGQLSFLTKGDNRLELDARVFETQVMGRVVRVDKINLRSFRWRTLGWLMGWISYCQFQVYHLLAQGRMNRFRHQCEKEGFFPRMRLRIWFRVFTSPLFWCLQSFLLFKRFHLKQRLRSEGVRVEFSSEWPLGPMTHVWNKSFSSYKTTSEWFCRIVCSPPSFSSVFLATQSGQLLGWSLLRLENSQGYIDVFALEPREWVRRTGHLLFYEALSWFKKRGAKQILLNPHPIPESLEGVPVTPLLAAASEFGFVPIEESVEFRVLLSEYHRPHEAHEPTGLSFRSWCPADDGALMDFFKRNRRDWATNPTLYSRQQAFSKGESGMFVAVSAGSIVGYCRCIADDHLNNYSQITWVWAASASDRRRGYFLRFLVDSAQRGRGIGTALAARAFQSIFDAGCEEICLVCLKNTRTEHFYRRFGFRSAGRFLSLRWQDPS